MTGQQRSGLQAPDSIPLRQAAPSTQRPPHSAVLTASPHNTILRALSSQYHPCSTILTVPSSQHHPHSTILTVPSSQRDANWRIATPQPPFAFAFVAPHHHASNDCVSSGSIVVLRYSFVLEDCEHVSTGGI